MPRQHSHTCPKCGTVWIHGNGCAGRTAAHTCPVPGCGGESWLGNRNPGGKQLLPPASYDGGNCVCGDVPAVLIRIEAITINPNETTHHGK